MSDAGQWTDKLPTTSGWYFCQYADGPIELVQIDELMRVWDFGDALPGSLANYEDYLWRPAEIEPPARD